MNEKEKPLSEAYNQLYADVAELEAFLRLPLEQGQRERLVRALMKARRQLVELKV